MSKHTAGPWVWSEQLWQACQAALTHVAFEPLRDELLGVIAEATSEIEGP